MSRWDINDKPLTFDGHKYTYDIVQRVGEKMMVWDADHNLVGQASIDHHLEQIHIEALTDGNYTSANYFDFTGQPFNYEELAKHVVVAAIY